VIDLHSAYARNGKIEELHIGEKWIPCQSYQRS